MKERLNIVKDSVFMLASVMQVFFLFVIDYALFWVSDLIDHHGRIRFYFGGAVIYFLLFTITKVVRADDGNFV